MMSSLQSPEKRERGAHVPAHKANPDISQGFCRSCVASGRQKPCEISGLDNMSRRPNKCNDAGGRFIAPSLDRRTCLIASPQYKPCEISGICSSPAKERINPRRGREAACIHACLRCLVTDYPEISRLFKAIKIKKKGKCNCF